MQSSSDLIKYLDALLRAKHAVSFYLNGGPGTGKSHLLRVLASTMPSYIPRVFTIGPHQINASNVETLNLLQMQACVDAGFVADLPPQDRMQNLTETWQWFGEHAQVTTRQVFVVLVDLEDNNLDLSTMADLFSGARYLEKAWPTEGGHILYMFAGSWDNAALVAHFERIGVSFPYTENRNYVVWEGIDPETMLTLVKHVRPEALDVHTLVLYELGGGNPAIAKEILQIIDKDSLSVKRLLHAVPYAVKDSSMGRRIMHAWPGILAEGQELIRQLLGQRCVLDPGPRPYVDQLLVLGVLRRKVVGKKSYLEFRSWYIETLFRRHLDKFSLEERSIKRVKIQEMCPQIVTINSEAYRLVYDIETSVRNYVALQLQMRQESETTHILMGKAEKYIEKVRRSEDVYQRATYWREKNRAAGLPTDLNPLLSYCSTRDLANLVKEIGQETESVIWHQIGQAIHELAAVRDAVMHNQIIDDEQLEKLYALRATVYAALAEPSPSA